MTAALIAVGLVVSIVVVVRRQWQAEAPLPTDDTASLTDTRQKSSSAPARDAGSVGVRGPQGMDKAEETASRRQRGSVQRRAEPWQSADQAKEALALESRTTATNTEDAARQRDDVVRNLPERTTFRASDQGNDVEAVATADPRLPRGTRFAAPLVGTTAAIDGSTPIVEKNTDRAADDGIYFPPDAELAYANRAGVQGDAGTVALWVEPVDWMGSDASVHSLFRVNDPHEGSYRFHLLKDAAYLRFQFITERGETNVRVPIEWWPRGEGHHVAATWGDETLRLYVDGMALGEQPYTGTLLVTPAAPGWWGSVAGGGTPGAGAILKDTLVTSRPLDDGEIQHLWQQD